MKPIKLYCFVFILLITAYSIPHPINLTNNTGKIITPNGDGKNDYFEIAYDYDSVINGKIYNINGGIIATMEKDSTAQTFRWYGKDSADSIVASGLYIYQIETSGISNEVKIGLIVVIR